jgi:hypothetical protein
VCAFILFVLSCALRQADDSSKEPYRLCKKDQEIKEEARVQQRNGVSLLNE